MSEYGDINFQIHFSFIYLFIHFNSGSKAHKQQTEAMT